MNSNPLFAVTIKTNSENGYLIDELLPSIDFSPTSYFDVENDSAQINLYYDTIEEAHLVKEKIACALKEWTEFCAIQIENIEIICHEIKNEDWSEKWKEFFHVEKISERLVIKPKWENYQAQNDEVIIEIDPGMSFGTGSHGTTKGCLKLIDRLSNELSGSFLDMGCGSAILAIAAGKLGFSKIDAFDYDELAVKIAKENLALAGIANATVDCVDIYNVDTFPTYDLVVANILASVLVDNAHKIAASVARNPTARLILSGILHEQFEGVKIRFEQEGFSLIEQVFLDKWSTGLFKRLS